MMPSSAQRDPVAAGATPVSVRVRDLAFAYLGKNRLLDIPNLEVAPGNIVSILGPSGCGKTTLMLLLAGLVPPTVGQVEVFGMSAQEFRISGAMAVVFQNPSLLAWRNVIQNVRLPFELMGRTVLDAQLLETLQLVGLTEAAHVYPDELSGGMQTRVALARAIATNPRLLLMDEPFGNLDEFNRVRLNIELAGIQENTGMSIFIITHNIHDALLISDRVLVLKQGTDALTRIVEDITITFSNKSLASASTPEFSSLYNKLVRHFYENNLKH